MRILTDSDNISAAEDVKIQSAQRSTEKHPDHRLERMHIFFFFHPIFRVPERKTFDLRCFLGRCSLLFCPRLHRAKSEYPRPASPGSSVTGRVSGVLHAVQFCTIILRTIFRRPGTHPIIRGHRVFFSELNTFCFLLIFYSGTISAIQLYHIRIYYNIKKVSPNRHQ